MGESSEKNIGYIKDLKPFLSDVKQKELAKILEYGEEMKVQWEKRKKEFWKNHNRNDFLKLLNYWVKHQKEIESEYEYLDKMNDIERKKFIEEYLYDDILYHGKLDEKELYDMLTYNERSKGEQKFLYWTSLNFSHDNLWLEWLRNIIENLELKEWMCLMLTDNKFWDDWVEALSHMKLMDWVELLLNGNNISWEWAKAIANNIELKEWVHISLQDNEIWYGWAEAISHIKLKEWVVLNLSSNEIWDVWAKAIAENMEFKERVSLNLSENKIWDEWAEALSHMELQEWVYLDLSHNKIWDKWVQAIIENMKFKKWVVLDLSGNNISRSLETKLQDFKLSYNKMWIYIYFGDVKLADNDLESIWLEWQ